MQISKNFLAVCAVMCSVVSISIGSPDTAAQTQARKALRKKMAELQAAPSRTLTAPIPATPAPTSPAPATTTSDDQAERMRQAVRQKINELNAQPPKAQTATAPAPTVEKKPAPLAKPAVVQVPVATTDETDRLREAVRRKIAQLDAQENRAAQAAPTPAPAATIVKPPAKKPADQVKAVKTAAATEKKRHADEAKAKTRAAAEAKAVEKKHAPVAQPVVILATAATTDETAGLREAVRRKIAQLDAQENSAAQAAPAPAPAATVVKPPAKKSALGVNAEKAAAEARAKATQEDQKRAAAEAKARQAKSGKPKVAISPETKPEFAPLEAPPSSVPASKEARLAELLRQYKADAITPEEYHKARAKILAEP